MSTTCSLRCLVQIDLLLTQRAVGREPFMGAFALRDRCPLALCDGPGQEHASLDSLLW